ncbi:MAG: 30S ribosomal protein S4 [Patescibacteria group bacterium]|nr:30S ribosomal protein S4 [Patescibacteria group bacterium]
MKLLPAKEKKERALGTRLGLKPFRSLSPKAAMVRRPYRPGVHGSKRVRAGSEFKLQLMEKQKMKVSYGLTETQLQRVFEYAISNKKEPVLNSILDKLESRLDSVVYRMGLAPSRIVGRQLVNHGHFMVNGRKVTIPSYHVRVGDVVSVRESSKTMPLFKDLKNTLKGNKESWIKVNEQEITGTVVAKPEHIELPFNLNLVVDYYAR